MWVITDWNVWYSGVKQWCADKPSVLLLAISRATKLLPSCNSSGQPHSLVVRTSIACKFMWEWDLWQIKWYQDRVFPITSVFRRSRWPRGLRRVSGCLLGLRVRIPPVVWKSVLDIMRYVGKSLCDGPIPVPEGPPPSVCVSECNRLLQ